MEQQYNQTTDLFLDEPVVYAGFWERFAAAFIDGLVLLLPNIAFSLLLPYGVSNVVDLFVSFLYFAVQESGTARATIGKKAMGLRVTSVEGAQNTFGQATGRYFGRLLSTLIIFVGYLMMLWDKKHQILHDKLAGTLVIKA